MFNLESSITAWRNQMLAAGIQSPVPLDELENHLREEVERQLQAGLGPQPAFESAARQIGQVSLLKNEFGKIGPATGSPRLKRWIISFILLASIIPLSVDTLLKTDLSLAWQLAGFANIVLCALSVLYCRQINRLFPVIPDKRLRASIGFTFCAVGMVGAGIFMNFILPHFSFTQGQLTVVVLWVLTLPAALGAIWDGLEEAARRQTTTAAP